MPVADLILVRHGESTGNVAREEAERSGADVIPVGARDADVPLTELGVRQAEELGRFLSANSVDSALAWPTAVWSSPYLRARQTAECIVAAAGLPLRPRLDERLRDKELGVLDTLTTQGVRNRFPGEADRRRWLGKFYYRPPGGESWADLALRLRSVLWDLDRLVDGCVLVVTHDAVISVLRYICEGLDEQQVLQLARDEPIVNTAVTRLRRVPHRTADPFGTYGAGGTGYAGDTVDTVDAVDSWTLVAANQQQHLLPAFAGADLRTTHPAGPADAQPQPEQRA